MNSNISDQSIWQFLFDAQRLEMKRRIIKHKINIRTSQGRYVEFIHLKFSTQLRTLLSGKFKMKQICILHNQNYDRTL